MRGGEATRGDESGTGRDKSGTRVEERCKRAGAKIGESEIVVVEESATGTTRLLGLARDRPEECYTTFSCEKWK